MPPMRVSASAPAGVALLVAAGCGGDVEPPPSVSAVVPAMAYSDGPVVAQIQGGPFRPAYRVDISDGRASIVASSFTASIAPSASGAPRMAIDGLTWQSTDNLGAELPAGLAPGPYDIQLRDVRGNASILPRAFTSLGPDQDPPAVTIADPTTGAVVAADTEVPVVLRADDGFGHLAAVRWTLSWRDATPTQGTCALTGQPSSTTCRFTFVAPQLAMVVDTLSIEAEAEDTAGNVTRATTQIWVGMAPLVTGYHPVEGPTGGGTQVTISGMNFIGIPGGTQIFFDDALADPNGGIVDPSGDGSSLIYGSTPPHDPGVAQVYVQTGGASRRVGTFTYVARPLVRAISPQSGAPTGGTAVQVAGDHFRQGVTRIFFGKPSAGAELSCVTFISDHLLSGITPPGTGQVSVVARDPVSGDGELTGGYTYNETGDADSGVPSPFCPDADAGAP
jgi:IPT/TIG domain